MINYQWMQPITDTETLIEYHEQISRVMLGIYSDKLLFVKQRGWVASLPFNDFRGGEDYKERFTQALARRGYSEFKALYWEVFKNEPPGFAIPATLAGVQECILKLVPGSLCVLFAGKPDWLIFLTQLNYMVIAGAPDFVTEVLGCLVETGFESLQDYLTSHEDRLIPEEKISDSQ
ncbi:hypothetical protein ACN4EG_27575 [Alkalinema pantanalense CENA528]|uniref:hypothetical protein n=1 Tax=Alkalinema pantanalense TaxID=1620705 RepID=UPI003D6FA65C